MTIQQYEDYGRQLVEYVPEEDVQFCYVEEIGGTDEVIKTAKNGLTTAPLLVWEAFDETLGNAGKDSHTSLTTGSLAVLFKTDGSIAGRRQARERSRQALLVLLARMRQDETDNTLPVEWTRIENDRLALERVGPVGANWYGMAVMFTWRVPLESRF